MTAAGRDTLFVGDLAPWFRQRCIGEAALFSFDMAAGRAVALCFYGSAADPAAQDAIATMRRLRDELDPGVAALFGVSNDPGDESDPALGPRAGLRHFADAEGAVSRLFGASLWPEPRDAGAPAGGWFLLDQRLRIAAILPLDAAGGAAVRRGLHALALSAKDRRSGQAPVLVVPSVFEPAFCQRLIGFHQETGGEDSAVLTEGARITDHGFKRRRDRRITDEALIAQVQTRIFRRVVPELRHVFQFEATRLERLIVAAYDAEDAGRFGPHRDNTVAETAHRRFAVSINLNDDFDGGDLVFPEYSTRPFRPPLGGALVFSCSMLHAVVSMTRGRRYGCLPFVYDDAAAELRRRRPKA